MTESILVSAVIKARNEAHQIAECITTLRGLADEVIVVDDRSSDETAAFARECGARVVLGRPHAGVINRLDVQGFLEASGTYLLRLDADERLTPGLASRLRTIAEEGRFAGARYARRYYFFGGWLDHGGWFRSQQLGFFRSDAWDRDWNCDIHSQVPVTGPIVEVPATTSTCMLHYDYFSIEEFSRRSLQTYARLEAAERIRVEPAFSAARMAKRALRRSAGRYFLRRGYRDGSRGAVVAGLLGAYEVCVEAYAWELRRNGTVQPAEAIPDGL